MRTQAELERLAEESVSAKGSRELYELIRGLNKEEVQRLADIHRRREERLRYEKRLSSGR